MYVPKLMNMLQRALQHGIYVYIMYVRMYLCVYVVNIIYERCNALCNMEYMYILRMIYIMYVCMLCMYVCIYVYMLSI